MMRNTFQFALSAALVAALATVSQATVLNFVSGFGSNANIQDHPQGINYGSNLTIADNGVEFDTTGPSGSTPDVTLTWGPDIDNVLEFHNGGAWVSPLVTPGVMQFDLNSLNMVGIPPNPTLDFTVPAGVAVNIESFVIGNANDQQVAGSEPPHAWTISLERISDGMELFTHTTDVFGTVNEAGGSELVNVNFTGEPGVGYRLLFDDNGGNHPRGAIDLVTFSQSPAPVPEPTSLALAAVCGLGLVARRRR